MSWEDANLAHFSGQIDRTLGSPSPFCLQFKYELHLLGVFSSRGIMNVNTWKLTHVSAGRLLGTPGLIALLCTRVKTSSERLSNLLWVTEMLKQRKEAEEWAHRLLAKCSSILLCDCLHKSKDSKPCYSCPFAHWRLRPGLHVWTLGFSVPVFTVFMMRVMDMSDD